MPHGVAERGGLLDQCLLDLLLTETATAARENNGQTMTMPAHNGSLSKRECAEGCSPGSIPYYLIL